MTESEVQLLYGRCGRLDRSQRGKLALTGSEAKAFLNGQVTQEIEALTPGSGAYAALLSHKGRMHGDLRILDLGDELWLDTERAALQAIFDALRRANVGFDAQLHKRTLQQGLISVIGPGAHAAAGADGLPDEEHASLRGTVGGVDVVFVSTDAGVDLICGADDVKLVGTALDCPEVGEAAAEVVRVEGGRPRYGVDLDDTTIPQEAGLNARAVSFTKGCYVGQETVARLFYRGKPNRHLRGLRLAAPATTGSTLRLGEREVGRLSSSVVSPRLGPIALALVRREAPPGTTVSVGEGDGATTAEVVELPFA